MKTLKWFIPALAIMTLVGCIIFLSQPLLSEPQDEETTEVVEETPVYDDLAVLYYYGNGDTRIHTWINTGSSSFTYSGSNGWFSTKKGGYEGNKLLHSVAGDWNGDGYADLAGFYDYGQGITRIHVWLNEGGTTFDYQDSKGWWESTRGYDAKSIVSASAGDYNGDGMDDIAAFYDYGNGEIRIHVWLSNGADRFKYEDSRGWWATKGYPATGIVNSFSGDFGD
ncbi:MAG TPA: VCBS repeat-containing protein [bacterium]|nr:VCBS repeat-containing protein [bacterium]HPN42525.1 VCBS repeat-containing protein [bacterium]